MDGKRKLITGAVAVLAALGVGTGVGIASSTDDDQPIAGNSRQRATQAALEHIGEGTVIETEMGDDPYTFNGFFVADFRSVPGKAKHRSRSFGICAPEHAGDPRQRSGSRNHVIETARIRCEADQE